MYIKKNVLNDGTHCYIIDNNKCFVYSEKLGEWIEEDNLKSFYLFTNKSVVDTFIIKFSVGICKIFITTML